MKQIWDTVYYLTASSRLLAMCFLLLEGVTQMALMPHTAGRALFLHRITPSWLSSSGLLTISFLMISLWRLTPPNWRVVEFLFFSFAEKLWLSSTGHGTRLYAFLIGSATRHPDILCDEMNRYTCHRVKCTNYLLHLTKFDNKV